MTVACIPPTPTSKALKPQRKTHMNKSHCRKRGHAEKIDVTFLSLQVEPPLFQLHTNIAILSPRFICFSLLCFSRDMFISELFIISFIFKACTLFISGQDALLLKMLEV